MNYVFKSAPTGNPLKQPKIYENPVFFIGLGHLRDFFAGLNAFPVGALLIHIFIQFDVLNSHF